MASKTISRQFIEGLRRIERGVSELKIERRKTTALLKKELQPVLVTAKRLVPKPGYPGDKPEFKALRSTISVQVRDKIDNVWYGMVGPGYPAGAHGHLVEGWKRPARHMIGSTTKFIEPALESHKPQIMAALNRYFGAEITTQFKRFQ